MVLFSTPKETQGLLLKWNNGWRFFQDWTSCTAGFEFSDGNIHLKVIKSVANTSSSVGGSEDEDVVFNFNPQSRQFIRKAFNTTPFNTNSSVVKTTADSYKRYWLGETFEDRVQELMSSANNSELIAFCPTCLMEQNYYDHLKEAQPAKLGLGNFSRCFFR